MKHFLGRLVRRRRRSGDDGRIREQFQLQACRLYAALDSWAWPAPRPVKSLAIAGALHKLIEHLPH
jgi:hypothetical protein